MSNNVNNGQYRASIARLAEINKPYYFEPSPRDQQIKMVAVEQIAEIKHVPQGAKQSWFKDCLHKLL